MEKKARGVKFGIYLSKELDQGLRQCMRSLGIKSKSRAIQEAIRLFIAENKWRLKGRVAGVIGVVYNHDVHGVDEKLTDIQHEYIEVIVATLHVHLTKEKCMLAIIVRGDSPIIRELVRKINGIKGVLFVRPLLLETT